MFVTKLVGLMYICIFFLDILLAIGFSGSFFGLIFTFLVLSIIFILLVISRQPQNRYALAFLTPGLPFIPTIAITVNIYLIFKLSILTLVRFTVWMSLGLIMYFYYGITNSLMENPTEEIELTVDQSYIKSPQKVTFSFFHMTFFRLDRKLFNEKKIKFSVDSQITIDDQKRELFGSNVMATKIKWLNRKIGIQRMAAVVAAVVMVVVAAVTIGQHLTIIHRGTNQILQ